MNNWALATSGALFLSGVSIAGWSHTQIPSLAFEKDQVQVEWFQTAPGLGTLLSGVCIAGSVFCFHMGMSGECGGKVKPGVKPEPRQNLVVQNMPKYATEAQITNIEEEAEEELFDFCAEREEAPYVAPDEYGEVKDLIDQGSIWFVGGKGSGKTEKLCWAMLEHCKLGHEVWFIDPFAPAVRYKGLKVFGRGLNYAEAAKGIKRFVDEAKRRIALRGTDPEFDPFKQKHIHLAMDEVSGYASNLDEQLMTELWEVNTQFLRQVNMSFSQASHGDTLAMAGGEKALRGKSKALRRDIVRVYCQWKVDVNVPGKRRCAGWANKVVTEAGDQEISAKIPIPEWMVAPPNHDYTPWVRSNVIELKKAEELKPEELEDVWA